MSCLCSSLFLFSPCGPLFSREKEVHLFFSILWLPSMWSVRKNCRCFSLLLVVIVVVVVGCKEEFLSLDFCCLSPGTLSLSLVLVFFLHWKRRERWKRKEGTKTLGILCYGDDDDDDEHWKRERKASGLSWVCSLQSFHQLKAKQQKNCRNFVFSLSHFPTSL